MNLKSDIDELSDYRLKITYNEDEASIILTLRDEKGTYLNKFELPLSKFLSVIEEDGAGFWTRR